MNAVTENTNVTEQPSEPQAIHKKPKKKRKWIKWVIILAVVAAAVFFGMRMLENMRSNAQNMGAQYNFAAVGLRDITSSLSGTGALQPSDSYTVTTLIEGEILSAGFEEGDIVAKDSTLYTIDASNMSSSIERAELTLTQAQSNYDRKVESREKYNITATESGRITSLAVKEGDNVTNGQTVANIVDSSVLLIEVPFMQFDMGRIRVGQYAELTLLDSFDKISGKVSEIDPIEHVLSGNTLVRYVTIEIANPGSLSLDAAAIAVIGGVSSIESGTFSYKSESVVKAEMSGTVDSINYSVGDKVTKGKIIIRLSSDSLEDEISNANKNLRDAEISLENQYDQLESYSVTSPINGTIIEKFYKAGDTLSAGKTLCTIYDLSYLTFTMNIDELDIMKIKVGQQVSVTADALAGERFQGVVTKISIKGSTSGGVTTYPVTVRIDETGSLLPGMNINAEIVISESKNVVAIPVEAVMRGNRVLVKTGETAGEEGIPPGGAMTGGAAQMGASTLPEGYAYRQVETGVSDDKFIEIISGLEEGDEIAYAKVSTSGGDMFSAFGGPAGNVEVYEYGGPGPGPNTEVRTVQVR